jgi:hypothetical protein
MLYTEIMAVCYEIHTKHINTLCGQEAESVIVKPGGAYSNQRATEKRLCQRQVSTTPPTGPIKLQPSATTYQTKFKSLPLSYLYNCVTEDLLTAEILYVFLVSCV